MKAAELRQAILQAAVQGRLVPQDKSDEPASELLKRIQKEKALLVKDGKIKKEKPFLPISDDEVPYDLPDGWVWSRLGDTTLFVATGPFGSMLHKSDYVEAGIPLVNPANMKNGRAIASDRMMVDDATRDRLSSYILHTGDIVKSRILALFGLSAQLPKGLFEPPTIQIALLSAVALTPLKNAEDGRPTFDLKTLLSNYEKIVKYADQQDKT